jgi:anti-sigma factor RsiW
MMMNDFTNQPNVQNPLPPEVENEFFMLMSLALDDMLDGDERLRFDGYLAQYPVLAQQWQSWQEMDATFQATPSAMPPADFVADVELRILQRERQRSLLWGLGLGVVVLALWVGLIAGAVSFGAFVMFNQAEWLSRLVHLLAQSTATVNNWWSATMITLDALLATDQARMLLVAYGLTAAAMLGGWVVFLRRSTRVHESATPIYTRSA